MNRTEKVNLISLHTTKYMLQINSIYDSFAMYLQCHNGSTSTISLIVTQIYNGLRHPP